MKLGTIKKQPAEKFSYTINYEDALTANDNVASTVVAATPAGLTITNVAVYDPRVKFWVSGGTEGTYKLTVTTTTADGRIFQDELVFIVKEVL